MNLSLIKKNIELKEHSSFQIGGRAAFFAEPVNYEEFIQLLDLLDREQLHPFFFGFGSNLLFPDNPSPDCCYISLKRMNQFSIEEDQIIAAAGLPLSILAIIGLASNTDIFDFSYLLPGSIGAAIYINARYFEREISGIVKEIEYLDLEASEAEIKKIRVEDCEFGYKTSIFQKKSWLILKALFSLPAEFSVSKHMNQRLVTFIDNNITSISRLSDFYKSFSELKADIRSTVPYRKDKFLEIEEQRGKYKHFDYPSAGSVFKNSRELGKPIGQIIDELGLKGSRSGAAQISPYHGNIIINTGNAQASEVINLIDRMTDEVFKVYGIRPEPEIVVVK